MPIQPITAQRYVVGPDGMPLTLANLPAKGSRWNMRRKAEVVYAVRGGLLAMEDACERYAVSLDEYLHWQALVTRHGMPALRVTRAQRYRKHATRVTLSPDQSHNSAHGLQPSAAPTVQ